MVPCGDPLVSGIGPLLASAGVSTAVGLTPAVLISRSVWQYSHVTPSQLSFFCSVKSLDWPARGEWHPRQVLRPEAPKSASAISSASWKRRLSMAWEWEDVFHVSWIARWQRPHTSALLSGSSGADRPAPAARQSSRNGRTA